MFNPFESLGRVEQSRYCIDLAMFFDSGTVFRRNKMYFMSNVGGVEYKYGMVVSHNLWVHLEWKHVNYIKVCLESPVNTSNLVVFFLLQVFDSQSLEFLK